CTCKRWVFPPSHILLPVCSKFPYPSVHHHPPLPFSIAMHLDRPCTITHWHKQFATVCHILFLDPIASSPYYKDRNVSDSRSTTFCQHYCTQQSCLHNL